MQDKQKVTLYVSQGLHRQLKVKSAVECEPMSSIVEKAIVFYLAHPDIVDEVSSSGGSYGQTHTVHSCPKCSTSVVVKDGELIALGAQPTFLVESDSALTVKEGQRVATGNEKQDEELIPCSIV